MDKITIKNISSAKLVLVFNDLNFRRELVPGRSISVDKSVYDEMTFDPGFSSMISEHYLKISGLEEDEKVEVSVTPIFEREELMKIFDDQDVTAFAKIIPTAAPAEKDTIVRIAIDKKITNSAFVSLIKKYCDVDVVAAIYAQHQAEE